MNKLTGHLEIRDHRDGRPIEPVTAFNEHLDAIRAFLPQKDSRAKSIAKTHLDEFVVWAEQALEEEGYDL